MELRKINTQDAAAQWEYTTALPADENGLTNPYHGVSFDEYKEKVLPELISYEHPVHMPDWFVPETYYYLWDEDRLIGEFRIRHHLTDTLRNGSGHIGYSIRKEERGKGYGTAGLKLTVQIAKNIIPEEKSICGSIWITRPPSALCFTTADALSIRTKNISLSGSQIPAKEDIPPLRKQKKFWPKRSCATRAHGVITAARLPTALKRSRFIPVFVRKKPMSSACCMISAGNSASVTSDMYQTDIPI